MSGKLVFLAAFLGVGGYVGYKVSNHDPAVVPYSKAQVQDILTSAKTSLPRRDGDGEILIWGGARTAKGVDLSMRYSEGAPQIDCEAVVTELGPNESRVIAACDSSGTDSAIGKTTEALRVPMFDEHIQATLHEREFDRSRVDSKEAKLVMKNIGGMQREALREADKMQRVGAEIDNAVADFEGVDSAYVE